MPDREVTLGEAVTTFVRAPVTAPTHGPQSIAEKIVPIVSRYIGSFKNEYEQFYD